MYNCNVVITYNYYDNKFKDYNEKQNVDLSIIDPNDITDDISDTLYRFELLGVFGLIEFDEKIINKKVEELCTKLSDHSEFTELMKRAAGKMLSEDLCTGLMILFSYDTFFLVHRCICEYLTVSTISIEKMQSLYTFSHFKCPQSGMI